MKNFFKISLAAISYYSLKKVIERLPEKYQGFAVLALRTCVFFILFLILFAFMSGRISAISRNLDGLPVFMANLLLGMAFVVTGLISFLLTAFVEEVYRILSAFQRKVTDATRGVIGPVTTAGENVKLSVEKTKNLFVNMGRAFTDAAKALYETSAKITDVAVSRAIGWTRAGLKSKQTEVVGIVIVNGAKKSGGFILRSSSAVWCATKAAVKSLGETVEGTRKKWFKGGPGEKRDV
ncbi:MAG: hypothetical protein WC352_06970 [Candidatus Omnitrophota bacterium]|jgi:hypothetical protein